MTLDEAKALRCGDLVHGAGRVWRVEDELHEAGGDSAPARAGYEHLGITHLMRLQVVGEGAHGLKWLVSDIDLSSLHLPERQ